MTEPQATLREDFVDRRLFREPQRARRDLDSLSSRLPGELMRALALLLSESPDPDQALSLFERLISEQRELVELFETNRVLLHYAVVIFGHSYWLGETLLRNPDTLRALGRESNLERSLEQEEYSQRLAHFRSRSAADGDLSLLLARFKKREYVRIALRDLLGIATLAETTGEISALAEAVIQEALREAESQTADRYGPAPPQTGFAVLALGKLGGSELNYSSDLDLLYLYRGHQSDGPLSCDEYFIRQAQMLTTILSQPTAEGAVFRIDLRLRPQGREGEPAVSLQHALDYYVRRAADWELQALIKSRHVAGDAALAHSFLDGIQNQVYTEHLNFAAIETALHSREKIDTRNRRSMSMPLLRGPAPPDVKLDHGGIRDIEFLAQCLQRVYGGGESWLRSSGTMFSLQKLHDKEHLDSADFQQLSQAYQFLRHVEHRLQLQRGQQVHRLPQAAADLEILRRALGLQAEPDSGSLLLTVQSCMAGISEIYRRVIHSEKGKQGRVSAVAQTSVSRQEAAFRQIVERIAEDSPGLSERLRRASLGWGTRRALHRFLTSVMNNREAYAALLEDPQAVDRVLVLLESGEYLSEILVRHPDMVRALPDQIDSNNWPEALSELSAGTPSDRDIGEVMAALRREFQMRTFIGCARDVLAALPALDSMRETTRAAENAIHCALRAIGGNESLAVFAMGRLGTEEFDIASDADLLFVRDPGGDEEQSRAIAEKLVHVLAAYTRDGTLFAVDARLRPRGGEGELVVTPAQLENYLATEAQSWEALTYSKMRFVSGRQDLAPGVLTQVRARIIERAGDAGFPQDVREMRTRLEKSNRYAHSFKLAQGGFYDIDFITSFLMLRQAALHQGNTLERLAHVRQKGFLDQPSFTTLAQATVLYRTVDHVIRLVTGRARPEIPEAEHARATTERLAGTVLQREAGRSLQRELEATAESVRKIFLQLVRE